MEDSKAEITSTNQKERALNIIKARDDYDPVYFIKGSDGEYMLCAPRTSESNKKLADSESSESEACPKSKDTEILKTDDLSSAATESTCSPKSVETEKHSKTIGCPWLGKEKFGIKELRPRIEPWLTALFQSEHLALLLGSGLTHAVHYIACEKNAANMDVIDFGKFNEQIIKAAEQSASDLGRGEPNIEDQIRVASELLRGLEVYNIVASGQSEKLGKEINALEEELKGALRKFAQSILKSESGIAQADGENREKAFNLLVNFLMSFASRTGTRDRLNIFTTNYDRLIEVGAELAGMHLMDRFVGSLMPIFRSSRLNLDMHYNPPGIRGEPRYLEGVARFTKLHGSVDWVQSNKDIRRIGLPFGAVSVQPFFNAPGLKGLSEYQLMIYPNAAKDRETACFPYVELFRDFAAAVCRPNSTLITYGYSFGDEHINRMIEDMLTIPSTHLVIISFDDANGRIMAEYEVIGKPSQVTLLIGPELGDLEKLTSHYLPKSAIDRATFRMGELLRKRLGTKEEADSNSDQKKQEYDLQHYDNGSEQ